MHSQHKEILTLIRSQAGKATKHTFLENYLGNKHPRYPISTPALRKIAKTWMAENRSMTAAELSTLLTALISGTSFTEKIMAGILLDYAHAEQRKFDIKIFDQWLDQLEGWAEVDALCTGKFSRTEIPQQWKAWSPLLKKFSRSKNIHKRRASLVFLCAPLSQIDDAAIRESAFMLIDTLKHEKEILITKAISWLLRSMIKHHHAAVKSYLAQNAGTLPAIAVRETRVKLETGRKGLRKNKQGPDQVVANSK